MSPGQPRRGLVGAALGVVALGAAVGLSAERYAIGRTRLRPDPDAREPFFTLPADRTHEVLATDGVRLHVEEVGPATAELTMVFVHGYANQLAVWHYQRRSLAEDNPGKLVFYDHRSHGRSGRGAPESSTIEQLGQDLLSVLDAVAPEGPVVLVGHSMGGMSVMALADAHPELFGPRVVGVALVSTSTGRLAELTLGLPTAVLPVTRRVLPLLTRGAIKRPRHFERGRRVSTDLAFLFTRYASFGSREVSPSVVEMVERMVAEVPVEVLAEFYDTFTTHDKLSALEVLRGVEALVLVGSKDLVTPEDHSRAMAAVLPDAHLVVVEGAGHMVPLECGPLVTLHLRALVRRANRAAQRSA